MEYIFVVLAFVFHALAYLAWAENKERKNVGVATWYGVQGCFYFLVFIGLRLRGG